ncbi:MAG: hypothetical protein H0X51_00420 [Parachlamydiaceae bacterium]|nr:hypothetical protein [Parachlamydiaceae bacterium]
MRSRRTNNVDCLHSNHLFLQPLCHKQALLRKIGNVVFHILTLGIPLAIYRVISCRYCRPAVPPYSALGQEVLEFARKSIKQAKSAYQFGREPSKTHQPINREIAYLTTLWNEADQKLKDLIKQHRTDPWSRPQVVEAADVCMKLGYAISNLTLDDLPAFTAKHTFALALTKQDSYRYRTFYYCTNAYHHARGEAFWDKRRHYGEGIFFKTISEASEAYASRFYQEGTVQRSWNTLYNEYCDRVRLYVKEEDLSKADGRHVNWTQKDTEGQAFNPVPDTQPT